MSGGCGGLRPDVLASRQLVHASLEERGDHAVRRVGGRVLERVRCARAMEVSLQYGFAVTLGRLLAATCHTPKFDG